MLRIKLKYLILLSDYNQICQPEICGPGSIVGIATGYELDSQGIESRWWRDIPHLSRPALGSTQPPVQWVPGLSRGKERLGRDADPSPTSSAVGHGRGELYFYSPYGPYGLYRTSVPVQECTWSLYLYTPKISIEVPNIKFHVIIIGSTALGGPWPPLEIS